MSQPPKGVSALAAKFKTIASGRLDRLGRAVLELEKFPGSPAIAEEAMREIHTLKGEAKMLGFAEVNRAAHRTEEAMLFAKGRDFAVGPEVQDVILAGLDLIGRLLGDEVPAPEAEQVLATYSDRVHALSAATPEAAAPAVAVAPPPSVPLPSPPRKTGSSPSPATGSDEALRSLMKLRALDMLSVPVEKIDALTALVSDVLQEQSRKTKLLQALARTATTVGDKVRDCQGLLKLVEATGDGGGTRGAIVRIQEQLMDMTALQSDTLQLVSKLSEAGFGEGLWLTEIDELFREVRMVRLQTLFGIYPRAVRDLARQLGKQARLEIRGESLGVDKNVLDQIGEPILHLIRNAIDHGLEPPEERRAGGKPAEGCLVLEASQSGARLHLSISDDGRGIDAAKVKRIALERGLVTEIETANLNEAAVFDFMFQPGFSTSDVVTDISGRGVGLDVVKRRIEELGGSVAVTSSAGRGTAFLLEVPLSLAMVHVVLVKLQEGIYAIPSNVVVTLLHLAPSEIVAAPAGLTIHHEENVVPLADLSALLGLPATETDERDELARVVLIEHAGRRLALQVSQILGYRAVIQKKPQRFFEGLGLLAATATLGEGEAVLILSVPEIFAAVRGGGRLAHPRSSATPKRAYRILVAEDSEITRILLVEILRGVGYQVMEAGDGKQAIDLLERDLPDLVMTDLDMPILNGFELLRQLRAEGRTKSLPIVVFSARGAESDQKRALDLGADAYLVKSRFRESDLLATVRRFLPELRAKRG